MTSQNNGMNKTLEQRLKEEFQLDDTQIAAIHKLGVTTADDMAELTAEDFRESGINLVTSRKLAKTFGGATPVPAPATTGSAGNLALEETTEIKSGRAPDGTTAIKKPMRLSSTLARSLGLPLASYTGCSYCRYDLDEFAAEEGISISQVNECPNCGAIFVAELKIACYACGANMTSAGSCVRCGGKQGDPEDLKIMTIYVRQQQTGMTDGKALRATARTYLQEASLKAEVVAKGRAEKWVMKAEEGGLPGFQGGPFRLPF